MAEKILLDTAETLSRLGLPDLPEINDAVTKGINSAHVFFEACLQSPLVKMEAFSDYFHLNPYMMSARPSKMFRLRLKHMFVKSGTVVVKKAETRKDMHAGGEVVPAEDLRVDYTKGLVFIEESYEDLYVSVDYQAGFDVIQKPPMWLTEAAITYLPSVLNLTQPTNRNDEYLKTVVELQKLAASMVNPYKRETALQLNPMYD